MSRASKSSRRPAKVSPSSRMILMASMAVIVPIMPGSTPSTPASAQLGTMPGGGGLAGINYSEVLAGIGKSVSVSIATLQDLPSAEVERGLFGQSKWATQSGGDLNFGDT